MESVLEKKREGYGGEDLWKRTVVSLERIGEGVVDGESACESIEKVPVIGGRGGLESGR